MTGTTGAGLSRLALAVSIGRKLHLANRDFNWEARLVAENEAELLQ